MESSSRKCCFTFEALPSRTRCGIVFSKPRQSPTWRCAGWAMYAISLPLSCIWKICPSSLTYSLKMHLGAICCCNSQSCTVKQLRSETAAEATDRSAPCCGPSSYFSARRYAWNETIPPPRAIGFNCWSGSHLGRGSAAVAEATRRRAIATIRHPSRAFFPHSSAREASPLGCGAIKEQSGNLSISLQRKWRERFHAEGPSTCLTVRPRLTDTIACTC